jgi:hypothetical protein
VISGPAAPEPPVASNSEQHRSERQHRESSRFGHRHGAAGDNDVVDGEVSRAEFGIPTIKPERDGRVESGEVSAQVHLILAMVRRVCLIIDPKEAVVRTDCQIGRVRIEARRQVRGEIVRTRTHGIVPDSTVYTVEPE